MAVTSGKPRMQTYYTVVFECPSRKTGKMVREVSDYVEDLAWFRARTEKRGGRIISESGPRQAQTIPVSF